ncbi:MAG: DUF885 domain-containing protein [Bacteroidetes bacterium]|nr:DUF885 domain-containing protein [Bacteroidota bacterium]
MKRTPLLFVILVSSFLISCQSVDNNSPQNTGLSYEKLTDLFLEWREFESPPLKDGAPDYTMQGFSERKAEFETLQNKLMQFDTTQWTIEQKVDWYIIWAEMNGYDFNTRVLRPWERDPAFYKSVWTERSDVPAHEGPTHHALTELWTYNFPLSAKERIRLIEDLKIIPPLNEQAMINLKAGNAKELFKVGIRDIETQSNDLKSIFEKPGVMDDEELKSTIQKAIRSTDAFVDWLNKEADLKNGPSGIGKENYTWYLENVHLVPMSWEDEVMLMKTELARAWSFLKLEEHRNRALEEIVSAESPMEYDALAERSVQSMMRFLKDEDILTIEDYFEPVFRAHMGQFYPKEKRHFFWITAHHDPRPLYSHFYHWLELARMDRNPHSNIIRRGALLYNIFDSRNEGIATGVEEMFMQAGFYNDSPRTREIVYILIAQRAARALGSLYAQANEMTMAKAGSIHSDYTPRGWMKTVKEFQVFEQHLYMRQPGYGTSYISGKYLLEDAMKDYAKKLESEGKEFQLRDFFDRLNSMGCIPMSLCHWELVGDNKHMK